MATAIPFALQIMNMSGWILEIGSNIFRQIGTVKDSMDTIAQPIVMIDKPSAPALVVREGGIVFDDVTFNYWRGKEGTVMENFNLTIAPGEKVGLVGRSGAGKSTLVNLLLRLFDVEAGSIRIDGQDVREVTQESVRAAIGLVSQDTSLLHRSVRENIKYGRQTATDEEMIRAAEQAKVADVIAGLLDPRQRRGYDAHVGERGRQALGRPAAARRHRPGAAEERPDPDPRRGDLGPRQRGRGGDPGAAGVADAGQDRHRHRPPPLDHRGDGPAGGARCRPDRRGGHARPAPRVGGHYAQLWERQSGGFLDLDAKAAETEAAE